VNPRSEGIERCSAASEEVGEPCLGEQIENPGIASAVARLSEPAFAEDWQSEEDAIYDTL
jgi:hypothetical protein